MVAEMAEVHLSVVGFSGHLALVGKDKIALIDSLSELNARGTQTGQTGNPAQSGVGGGQTAPRMRWGGVTLKKLFYGGSDLRNQPSPERGWDGIESSGTELK